MSIDDVFEARDKVKAWLIEEGLFKEEVSAENLYFQLAAEYPAKSGRHLSIIQPKGHEDMVVVFSRIRLADVHQEALSAMPLKARERLLWQMRYDLLFRECSFEMEPRGEPLQSIRFTREIYYDGLTKNKLMEAIAENLKCEMYVVWKFQEVFGEGQAGRVTGPPEPMYS
ncbi:MAG TPA: DUF2299 family protein [Methanothrix sp.]|nr:DUF2299 family protein [Methanothrix sp.]HPT18623.1 DUF2299 family protein [Methanothrix sp.]